MVTQKQSQYLDFGLDIAKAHILSLLHTVPSPFTSLAHIGGNVKYNS